MVSRNPFFSMTAALARSPRVVLFRNGPDFDACCQLLNTIFGGGAGLVPLPHAVRMLGPRAALPVIVACGAFSFYTSQAIVIASCLVGEATYQGVARRTLGHIGAEVVRLLLIVLAFSTGVAGLSIFADVAQILLVGWCTRTACLFIAGCIVTPLVVCIREIERLAVISVAAAGLMLLFLLYAIVGYVGAPPSMQGLAQIPHHGDRRTLAEALNAASVIHLSFNCHFNVLPLFYALPVPAHDTGLSSSPREPKEPPKERWLGGEALRQQQRRMRRVIGTATVLALGVYVTIGWLGYMAFGRRPSGNTFADYATQGFVGALINHALAVVQLVTLPLVVHEGVREFVDLLGATRGRGGESDPESTLLMREEFTTRTDSSRSVHLYGGVWCALMTLTAMASVGTTQVLVISALCGAPLMSVLPLLMLLQSGGGHATVDFLLLLLGTAAMAGFSLSAMGML